MSVVCGCVSVHTGVADVDVLHRSIEDGWLKTAVLLTNKGKRGHFLEGHKKNCWFSWNCGEDALRSTGTYRPCKRKKVMDSLIVLVVLMLFLKNNFNKII